MKHLFIFLLCTFPLFADIEPCEDYTCDSLAVQAILDSGKVGKSVKSVTNATNGRITSLNLESSNLNYVSKEINKLSHLKILNLRNNKIITPGIDILSLQNLKQLDISHNKPARFFFNDNAFPKLQYLDISSNQFGTFHVKLSNFPQLEYLNVSKTNLKELPSDINSVTKLKHLDVSSTEELYLTDEIVKLTELQYLNLSSTQSNGNVYSFISELKNLKELHLNNIGLRDLPDFLKNFPKLELLSLADNKITNIPSEFTKLFDNSPQSRKVHIHINNNRLCDVPLEIYTWLNKNAEDNWTKTQTINGTDPCKVTDISTLSQYVKPTSVMIDSHKKLVIIKPKGIHSFTIYTLQGKETIHRKIVHKTISVNYSKWIKGVYFIKVKTANGVYTKKFMNQ